MCSGEAFFQRAYDQFFQEMSLNRSRVTVLDFPLAVYREAVAVDANEWGGLHVILL